MSQASVFTVVMTLLMINLLLFVNGVRVIEEDNNNFLNKFINLEQYENTSNLQTSQDLVDAVPKNFQESGTGGFLQFVDALKTISSFVIFLVNIVFTPVGLFVAGGLPPIIGLILGIPLLVAGIFGIIQLVR